MRQQNIDISLNLLKMTICISETTGAPADNKDPLLSAPVTISVPYSTQGNDSPPPPYSD